MSWYFSSILQNYESQVSMIRFGAPDRMRAGGHGLQFSSHPHESRLRCCGGAAADNPVTRPTLTLPQCSQCGRELKEAGLTRGGRTYCCLGCSQGTGCICQGRAKAALTEPVGRAQAQA